MMAVFCIDCGKRLENILERLCPECYRKRREGRRRRIGDVLPVE